MSGTSKKNKMPKEQQTPFKELTFSEKLSYIWDYYKYHMLTVVIAAIVIASFVNAYHRNNYDILCSIAVIDGKISEYDINSDAITTGFTEYLGIDGTSERVQIDYNYSLKAQALDQDVYISEQKLYTLASTKSLDGYMSTLPYIQYFSTDEQVFFEDLTEILTADELDKIGEENIIYYTKKDGTNVPIAVNMTNTKIKTETDLSLETVCYGVVVTAPNRENAISFIRYAFDL